MSELPCIVYIIAQYCICVVAPCCNECCPICIFSILACLLHNLGAPPSVMASQKIAQQNRVVVKASTGQSRYTAPRIDVVLGTT